MSWIGSALCIAAVATSGLEPFDPFAHATPIAVQTFGVDCDRDYDGLPDEWTRRSGRGFPGYIEMRLDRREGHETPGSLKVTPDGAPAVLYSSPILIDGGHLYLFEAYLRTKDLRSDAAICSISILDGRKVRIGRHVTAAITGTNNEWVRVRIGPIEPVDGQHYLVVGCHLVRGDGIDLKGAAWFDDVRVSRTPLLALTGGDGRFLRPAQSTRLGVNVTGLERDASYRLSLSVKDVAGAELDHAERDLAVSSVDVEAESAPLATPWAIPGTGTGFYRLEADLKLAGQVVARREAAFVVTDTAPPSEESPFGWAFQELPREMTAETFAVAVTDAGLGRVKLPLWREASDRGAALRAGDFIERLVERDIDVVGVLDPPPDDLRRKFAADWSGTGEIYQLSPEIWSPALEPLVARYGARIRRWQLGRDGDASFPGIADLPLAVREVRRAFDRVGRNTQIGVPWPTEKSLPTLPGGFVSVSAPDSIPRSEQGLGSPEVWVAIRPLPAEGNDYATRAADLVKQVIAARATGANAIYIADALDSERGLLGHDGSPTELLLPWRTAAIALRGPVDLGPLPLTGGSRSRAFAGGDSATVVVWNDEPVTELFTPGGMPTLVDVWGRTSPLTPDLETGRVELAVGPSPLFLVGASAPLLRWQIEAGFEHARLRSQHGRQPQAIVGANPFSQGVSGRVTLKMPRGWEADQVSWPLRLAAGETFRFPFNVSLPTDASLGMHDLELDFEIQADRSYQFIVKRQILVGLGELEIEVTGQPLSDGRLEVVQTLTNLTNPPEVLNFRCDLFVPGAQRQRQYVVKLGPGRDTKRYYLPNAQSLIGHELRLRAEQENGRRVLNYRWVVGEDDQPKEAVLSPVSAAPPIDATELWPKMVGSSGWTDAGGVSPPHQAASHVQDRNAPGR